jgi:uncharacterized protein YgbK (DUF1537 family)
VIITFVTSSPARGRNGTSHTVTLMQSHLQPTDGRGPGLPRESTPGLQEVLAGLPRARTDGAALRASIRAVRAEADLLLGVLDDDPTGSQAVRDVQVVTVLEESAYAAALAGPAATCFVLTNTRSLGEARAVRLTMRAARGLMAVAERRGARIQLISRSDSTLRGHVRAEVAALSTVRQNTVGSGFDAVLLIPAFLEAGRLTAADIHWARVGTSVVAVGETEFARDAAFGYRASNLRDFVAEKAAGAIRRDDVRSINLADIRVGGPSAVRDLLVGLQDCTWVVVNATEYSDLEVVACGVLMAERAGTSLLFRTGPSFVRALTGLEPMPPLRGQQLLPAAGRGTHGLVVAGSHVGQTSRQVAALRAARGIAYIELDVSAVASGAESVVTAAAQQVTAALARSDVLLCTSRAFLRGHDAEDNLAIGRRISAALSRITGEALAAKPAWIVAKGGITAHDVAVHGLRIRRANVAGQLYPGMISVLHPIDAAPDAIGMPYVVFPGNVGDDDALAHVVALLSEQGPS